MQPCLTNKMSPATRTRSFSFLKEVTDSSLKSYTVEQLDRVLHQRAEVS